MNSVCLVIDTEELSYTLHDQHCTRLNERPAAAKVVNLEQASDDAGHSRTELLPSWDFQPCHCLHPEEGRFAEAG